MPSASFAVLVGKLAHGVEGLVVTFAVGLLLLAWRDARAIDLSEELAALIAMFTGIFFGVMWKVVEFVLDWVTYADLQKSNSDTMTDFLWNDVGAVIAAVLAGRAYCRWLSPSQRHGLGRIAGRLAAGPSRLLDRHGLLMTLVVATLTSVAVGALWFSGRPVPGVQIP